MNVDWRPMIWRQLSAAIDMIDNAMQACPDELWNDRARQPEFWYVIFHTLFFLDLYLSESIEGFKPPKPFTLDELNPEGWTAEEPYTKEELRTYLDHGRRKCRETIEAMTDEEAARRCGISWHEMSNLELLMYNLRHVQHHAGQLNLILRQEVGEVPRWVKFGRA